MNPKSKAALDEAIRKAGGLSSFAVKVGAPSDHAVKAWRLNGVPDRYCPTIERITGVACERLSPSVEWYVLRLTHPVPPAANDPHIGPGGASDVAHQNPICTSPQA